MAQNIFDDLNKYGKGLSDIFLKDFVANVKEFRENLDEQARSVQKNMTANRETYREVSKTIADVSKDLALVIDSGTDVANLTQRTAEIIQNIASELEYSFIVGAKNMVEIQAAATATGLGIQTITQNFVKFAEFGESMYNFGENTLTILSEARKFGANTNAVFTQVGDNLSNANKYGFQTGVDGLARMAAKAALLKIDMSDVFNFASKVFDPEGAISAVNTFQRLGVAVGDLADPFRLMYLAQEDTEGLQEAIGGVVEKMGYLNKETGKFEIPPSARRDLMKIQEETGLSYDNMVKMAKARAQLTEVSKELRIGGIDEETKMFLSGVANFDKLKGGFTVKVDGQDKLVSQLQQGDLEKLKAQTSSAKTLEDFAAEQLSTQQMMNNNLTAIKVGFGVAGIASSKALQDAIEIQRGAQRIVTEGVREGFRPEDQRRTINRFEEGSVEAIRDLIKGDLEGFDAKLGTTLSNITTDLVEGFSNSIDRISNIDFSETFKTQISKENIVVPAVGSIVEDIVKSLGLNTEKKPETVKVDPVTIELKGRVELTQDNKVVGMIDAKDLQFSNAVKAVMKQPDVYNAPGQ